jgi:large subunit ribosomal protein L4
MRDYTLKMPLKMRRAAVRSALSARAADQAVMVVDNFDISEPKTKLLSTVIRKLAGEKSALIIVPEKDSKMNVFISADNMDGVKVLMAHYLNIRDLLNYEKIILDSSSLPVIEEHLEPSRRVK